MGRWWDGGTRVLGGCGEGEAVWGRGIQAAAVAPATLWGRGDCVGAVCALGGGGEWGARTVATLWGGGVLPPHRVSARGDWALRPLVSTPVHGCSEGVPGAVIEGVNAQVRPIAGEWGVGERAIHGVIEMDGGVGPRGARMGRTEGRIGAWVLGGRVVIIAGEKTTPALLLLWGGVDGVGRGEVVEEASR